MKPLQALKFLLIFFYLNHNAFAQKDSFSAFFGEIHYGSQGCWGPANTQAMLIDGYDSTFKMDKKYTLGFKTSTILEITYGYQKKYVQFGSTITYYKQDFAFSAQMSDNIKPFALADILSVKASALFRLSDNIKKHPFGFHAGFFISTTFPLIYHVKEPYQSNFNVHSAIQLNWGTDYKYTLRIGKKGLYALAGAAITFPGKIGSMGKINISNTTDISIINEKIIVYSARGWLGIGYNFN